MTDAVIEAREAGRNIIWDQTSTSIGTRAKKFRMLPNYYAIAVVFPIPERQELERRLASRPNKIVPIDVVDRMIGNWEEPTLEEGFMEIWKV
jgi:predicted kinase